MPSTDIRILVSTAPPDVAEGLARTIVGEGLAACVNLLPGVRSVYRWEGQVRDEPETMLWMKTTPEALPRLQERLAAIHPYEVPEVLTLRPDGGSEAYLSWVRQSVTS